MWNLGSGLLPHADELSILGAELFNERHRSHKLRIDIISHCCGCRRTGGQKEQKREFVFRARVHPRPPQGPMDLEYSDDDDQLAKTRVVTYDPSPGLISSPVPV